MYVHVRGFGCVYGAKLRFDFLADVISPHYTIANFSILLAFWLIFLYCSITTQQTLV